MSKQDGTFTTTANLSSRIVLKKRAGAPWPNDLTPFDFQLDAVRFALARQITYLALDPGLGKTVVARIVCNRLSPRKVWRVFYVCPPFLSANVEAEFKKWGTTDIRLTIVPDSHLAIKGRLIELLWGALTREEPGIIFIDEAHRFKNPKASRTKGLFLLARSFPRVVFLSGTPMPNSRPIELWPILSEFVPEIFGRSFFNFAKTYCGARRGPFGWSFDGFSNQAEFKNRITSSGFMLRIRKSEVLDLPPKIESLLTVGDDMPAVVSKVERKILAHYSPEDLVEGRLAGLAGKDSLHLSEYLALLGEYKLKYALPYIDNLLAEGDETIILFCRHKKVVEALKHHYRNYQPTVIDGSTPAKSRQWLVNDFQTRLSGRRLLIGNIEACGVGFTITKASRVIFLEFSWRDGDNIQAADRAHRIGQDKSVLVQYVVLKNSIDGKRMQSLLTKRRNAV